MVKIGSQKSKAASIRLTALGRPLTSGEVKTKLRERGVTLKQWAEGNGYAYDTVSCVVRGVHRATYGVGHTIAVQLGMRASGWQKRTGWRRLTQIPAQFGDLNFQKPTPTPPSNWAS